MNDIQHENSDALLLLGIIYASDCGKIPANLTRIIRACDFIEHVIITYDELKGGLVRLVYNKHIVEIQKLIFIPSDKISQNFSCQEHLKKKRNAREDLEYIRNSINAKQWDSRVNLVETNKKFDFKELTHDVYESSCKSYLNGQV